MRKLVCEITVEDFTNPGSPGRSTKERVAIAMALGRVQERDIGKRVYNVGTFASPVYQVENDEQLAKRLAFPRL